MAGSSQLSLEQRLLQDPVMKLVAALATLIAVSNARPAEACSPAYTCGDEYCRGVTTVVEGTVETIRIPDVEGRNTATIGVTAVYGDAAGVTAGSSTTIDLGQFYPLHDGDLGKSLVLGLTRSGDGALQIEIRTELADPYTAECFGADATSATVADATLSPSCYAILVPNPPPSPACPDGPIYCDAGGARGSLWVLAAFGLVVRRRSRRSTRSRRAD
jgi:hypothetical protein